MQHLFSSEAKNLKASFLDSDSGRVAYAQTRITWSGKIVVETIEYYDRLPDVLKQSVDIHENVHVADLQPYAKYRGFGEFVAILNMEGGIHAYEVKAYRVQIEFLNKQITNLPSGPLRQQVLNFTYNARSNLKAAEYGAGLRERPY